MTEPRATYDAGTPATTLSPYQEIELIAMDAVDLYIAYAKTRGHTQEGSRIKALEKVAESLLRPSPTLAAMLAADELVAVLHDVQANLRTQAGIRQLATGRAAEMVLESSARAAIKLLARIDAVLAKAEASS